MQAGAARPGAQKFVSKLPEPLRAFYWQKAWESVLKPCAEMRALHTPGQQQARAQRGSGIGRVPRPGPCMCPVAVPALLYVESAEFGLLPSGSAKKLRRIRIAPVKQTGKFPALFALQTFRITFPQVSGVSGVQPAWAQGLR